MNNEEIEQYNVSLYYKTFETIINSVKVRYNTSPIVLAMEKYLTITNESELAECGTAISDLAAHLVINSCLLQTFRNFVVMKMKSIHHMQQVQKTLEYH